jgi:hypothetical protein
MGANSKEADVESTLLGQREMETFLIDEILD